MRKGKRNEIENKRWEQAGRQAGRGRFSSLIGCRLSLAVRSWGCSRLRSSDPSDCCRGESESALLHLDDLFLELTWSCWLCESGNTHFLFFRVCTWIMVHWVSAARSNCWDWPPALRACERRKYRLIRGCFRLFSEERYQRVCPWITACWGELCVFTAGQFFGCWMLFCRPDVSKMRAGGERAHFPAKRESGWVDALRLFSLMICEYQHCTLVLLCTFSTFSPNISAPILTLSYYYKNNRGQ